MKKPPDNGMAEKEDGYDRNEIIQIATQLYVSGKALTRDLAVLEAFKLIEACDAELQKRTSPPSLEESNNSMTCVEAAMFITGDKNESRAWIAMREFVEIYYKGRKPEKFEELEGNHYLPGLWIKNVMSKKKNIVISVEQAAQMRALFLDYKNEKTIDSGKRYLSGSK